MLFNTTDIRFNAIREHEKVLTKPLDCVHSGNNVAILRENKREKEN